MGGVCYVTEVAQMPRRCVISGRLEIEFLLCNAYLLISSREVELDSSTLADVLPAN